MTKAIPFYGSDTVYGTGKSAANVSVAIRGAGKWTKALLEARKTLNAGHRVWIRAEDTSWYQPISDLLQQWLQSSLAPGSPEYENAAANVELPAVFFGQYTFAETVGLWLKNADREASDLLSPFISTGGFAFTPAEYLDLRERLQLTIRRYERLPEVSHGLDDLNTGFFRYRSLEESREFISNHLATYLERGEQLHRRFVLAINRHARAVIFSARTEQQNRLKELGEIKAALAAAEANTGKTAKKALRATEQRWQSYQQQYLPVPPAGASIGEQLQSETEALQQLQRNLFRELQSAGLSLNSLTVQADHGDAAELSSLETGLNELIREVDEAGLYQLPLRGTDAATTPRQLLQLEGLLDKLRNTHHHLAELPGFYHRRHFWYAQPAHLRRLLAPLLNLPAADWETAFSAWYFERCLEQGLRLTASETPAQDLSVAGTPVIGKLHFLAPGADWPGKTSAEDLLISLTGKADLPEQAGCRMLRIAPLHETAAEHFALAGHRNPVLVLSQNFLPLNPPPWRVVPTETAPPGHRTNAILLQTTDATWQQLTDWPNVPVADLHLYLPVHPSPEDEAQLLQRWEYLVATAKEIIFFHSWTPDEITRALLSDGFSARFLMAALLRAAEAAETTPFDRKALVAIGHEIRFRCGLETPGPHPLAEHFGSKLHQLLPDHFFEIHQPWRDTFLPLVVLSPTGRKTVLLPDGKLPSEAGHVTQQRRQQELLAAGFILQKLDAAAIWEDPTRELKRVATLIADA